MKSQVPLLLKDLHKQYPGSTHAVKGVNLEIKPAEVFGLLGPNGAGKTSIISIITTLEKATGGTAEVFGYEVKNNPQAVKRLLGVVHQEVITSGFFDVEEILQFQSGYYGIKQNKERIDYLLQRLGLYEHRQKKVKQLSGGMKRRLMIAKALVHQPKLLLLDEPTAGVDIQLREDLWNFVVELKKSGITILLTTHYLEEAEQLCDRVGIISLGKLLIVDDTKRVIHQFTQKEILIKTSQKMEQQRDLASHSAPAAEDKPLLHEYLFTIKQNTGLDEFFKANQIDLSKIQDLQIREGSLEKAFLHLTQKNNSQASV